ncbi:MAG: hypothetical protein EOP84_17420 [Verrucomicrobiaceae bacterium]|nr:MAG: hypothetical protein EOP84_17420 [Verrucomicrobiaceae bacterium]
MSTVVRVQIPVPNEDGDEIDLAAFFAEQLDGQFKETLDYEVAEYDERATIDEIEITEVEVAGDQITVQYSISYSAYYGCKDQDYADVAERWDGDFWLFDLFVPTPVRTTFEEF